MLAVAFIVQVTLDGTTALKLIEHIESFASRWIFPFDYHMLEKIYSHVS